jgi:ornithine cyclodeaminase
MDVLMGMMNLNIVSNEQVTQAVDMNDAIEIIRIAFIEFYQGKADLPVRIHIEVDEKQAQTLIMPAYLKASGALGTKIISIFPENQYTDLPTIHALMIVIDSHTGQPQAIMDAGRLTALRTGAVSGVATDLLARKDARVAAIFGAGVQGRTQLQAVCTVRSIEKALVYDTDPGAAQSYVEDMQALSPGPSDIEIASSPDEALVDADIICTATTSLQPVFKDESLKKGSHINAIGSFTPRMQEIPQETVVRSKIVVDSLTASLAETGDLIIPLEKKLISRKDIHGELGEIASGSQVGRETDEEITLFKSVGLAIQDVALAAHILQQVREHHMGCTVDL